MVPPSCTNLAGLNHSISLVSIRAKAFINPCAYFRPAQFCCIGFFTFVSQLARHEHYLALQMGLKPGMRVLDVGCGVGGPAREIARFAGVKIVGVNNNDFQIGKARRYTEQAGLSAQVEFVKGDFMTLSEMFGYESFDAGEPCH